MREAMILGSVLAGALWLGSSFSPYLAEGQAVTPLTPEMAAHVDAGGTVFQQRCAFCHGADASGGESGPNLTRSKLVLADTNGDKISEVIRTGRQGRMPSFDLGSSEIDNVVAFIHAQQQLALKAGRRKGVDISDLQTGNAPAGRQYFEGNGTCSKCHSASGDLAHIATKYQGLDLERRMLYPEGAKGKATVSQPSGQTWKGTIEYQDEFTLGIILEDGSYRSWPIGKIRYTIDAPHEAHIDLFSKYTDADIHNLMAYLQTLR